VGGCWRLLASPGLSGTPGRDGWREGKEGGENKSREGRRSPSPSPPASHLQGLRDALRLRGEARLGAVQGPVQPLYFHSLGWLGAGATRWWSPRCPPARADGGFAPRGTRRGDTIFPVSFQGLRFLLWLLAVRLLQSQEFITHLNNKREIHTSLPVPPPQLPGCLFYYWDLWPSRSWNKNARFPRRSYSCPVCSRDVLLVIRCKSPFLGCQTAPLDLRAHRSADLRRRARLSARWRGPSRGFVGKAQPVCERAAIATLLGENWALKCAHGCPVML